MGDMADALLYEKIYDFNLNNEFMLAIIIEIKSDLLLFAISFWPGCQATIPYR